MADSDLGGSHRHDCICGLVYRDDAEERSGCASRGSGRAPFYCDQLGLALGRTLKAQRNYRHHVGGAGYLALGLKNI